MGNCDSSPETAVALATSRQIDQLLKEDKKKLQNTIKLLLLGAGETGKSTVLKQIKLIYGKGYEKEERKVFRSTILSNVMTCIKVLASEMDNLKIPFGFKWKHNQPTPLSATRKDEKDTKGKGVATASDHQLPTSPQPISVNSSAIAINHYPTMSTMNSSTTDFKLGHSVEDNLLAKLAEEEYFRLGGKNQTGPVAEASKLVRKNVVLLLTSEGFLLDDNIIAAIKILWADSGIQYCYSRSNEYHLMDCCANYLNDIDRICEPDYVPTDQDILYTRVVTTNIIETRVQIDKLTLRIFDVGGQRSERKKWAPYFDDVNAIIYLAAISSYDQMCSEDSATNRIVEAVNLFSSICNHPIFKRTAIILFLNKIDLFKEKLERSLIVNYFPKFKGENNYSVGKEFFSEMFLEVNKYAERKIYAHFTWATDTKQTKKVLESVNQIIMNINLNEAGI